MDILVPLVLHGGQHVGVSWYGTSGSYDGYLITATLQVEKLHNIKRFTNTREPLHQHGTDGVLVCVSTVVWAWVRLAAVSAVRGWILR